MKSDEERSLPLLFKAALQWGQVTGKLISFVRLRVSPPSQQVTAMAPEALQAEECNFQMSESVRVIVRGWICMFIPG